MKNLKTKIFTALVIFLSSFNIACAQTNANAQTSAGKDWLDASVPSLCQTYKEYFDYTGFAVEYGNFGANWGTKRELYYDEVQKGLAKHANTITMGNEFKPQFIMAWWGKNPSVKGTFTASNGLTIKTPVLNGLSRIDSILAICKKNGLKMRGHTLVWHSQTEDAFFHQDYNKSQPLVDKDEMDARLEWYIKTVLDYVSNWEKLKNNGEHIIWAWDVLNEATADGSQKDADLSTDYTHWLRTSGSKWFDIYQSPDFIVKAFQFANKYAPADVKLCYNDYGGVSGTTTSNKHKSQLRVIDLILSHQNDELPTRIDAMGLQSHHSVKNASKAVEAEIIDFIEKGLNVHITELDIGTWNAYDSKNDVVGVSGKQFDSLTQAYKAYFEVYIRNHKTADKNGVESITIWGLNDENTWLNSDSQKKWLGYATQYPLLLTKPDKTKWSYTIKPAFDAVIQATGK